MTDYPIFRLTHAFFLNLFQNIEKPSRINIERKQKWYQSVLDWTYKESLFFDLYEEYFEYDPERLRKQIREKIKIELEKSRD